MLEEGMKGFLKNKIKIKNQYGHWKDKGKLVELALTSVICGEPIEPRFNFMFARSVATPKLFIEAKSILEQTPYLQCSLYMYSIKMSNWSPSSRQSHQIIQLVAGERAPTPTTRTTR
jgi:hypothetical protein